MITSSVLNSVTFKDLDGGMPNKWNTLHVNRNQGGFTVLPYCQKYNKNDIIYLQFESDSATLPELKIYYPDSTIETIAATLLSSYFGDDTRYFYGFNITLNASFHNKKFYFVVNQGADSLTSEPVICEDLTEAIAKGTIRKVKYTNLDRGDSDLSNFFVDWSVTEFMYFYVEAVDIDPNDSENTEIIEGVQSKDIAASSNYSGIALQTGGIPDYLTLKLKAASSLDYFEINGIQYIKDGSVDILRFGNSTLHQCTLKLTEKNTIGLNVDDLGIQFIDQNTLPMAIIVKRNTGVNGAGWTVENPDGYMLHSVFIKHTDTSAADAVVKLGITIGGDELIDEVMGEILQAEYSVYWKSFPAHYLKTPDSAHNLYFTVTGAGTVLDIIVNFDTVTP